MYTGCVRRSTAVFRKTRPNRGLSSYDVTVRSRDTIRKGVLTFTLYTPARGVVSRQTNTLPAIRIKHESLATYSTVRALKRTPCTCKSIYYGALMCVDFTPTAAETAAVRCPFPFPTPPQKDHKHYPANTPN